MTGIKHLKNQLVTLWMLPFSIALAAVSSEQKVYMLKNVSMMLSCP